jgi:hypothetical protein
LPNTDFGSNFECQVRPSDEIHRDWVSPSLRCPNAMKPEGPPSTV